MYYSIRFSYPLSLLCRWIGWKNSTSFSSQNLTSLWCFFSSISCRLLSKSVKASCRWILWNPPIFRPFPWVSPSHLPRKINRNDCPQCHVSPAHWGWDLSESRGCEVWSTSKHSISHSTKNTKTTTSSKEWCGHVHVSWKLIWRPWQFQKWFQLLCVVQFATDNFKRHNCQT